MAKRRKRPVRRKPLPPSHRRGARRLTPQQKARNRARARERYLEKKAEQQREARRRVRRSNKANREHRYRSIKPAYHPINERTEKPITNVLVYEFYQLSQNNQRIQLERYKRRLREWNAIPERFVQSRFIAFGKLPYFEGDDRFDADEATERRMIRTQWIVTANWEEARYAINTFIFGVDPKAKIYEIHIGWTPQ